MRKSHALLPFIAVFIILVFASCSPKIYLPDRVNAPMLREQGDVKLTSSFKMQNPFVGNGFGFSPSFDLAASPVKGLGIITSYRSTSRYANDDEWYNYGDQDSIHYTGNKYELGLGYYKTFGKGIFECYGGYAFGNMNRDNLKFYQGSYKTDFSQVFIQPCIGLYGKDVMDFGGGMRVSYHWFDNFRSDDPAARYAYTSPRSDIESNTYVILAPYIQVNVGYKYVKFNAQLGANFSAGNPTLLQGNLPFYASVGATFAFAKRFLNKEDRD